MELYQIYRPITATPFRNNGNYTEVEPCSALKPYIRCFWGTASPQHASLASDPDSMGLPALPHSSGIKISALPHSDGIKMPALPHSDGIKMSAYPHSDSIKMSAYPHSDGIKMSALPHSDSIKMSAHHHSGGFHPAGENVFKSLSAPDNCGPGSGAYNIITPDTCADIIFHVDFTAGTIESAFCGINDSSFQSDIAKEPDSKTAEFAIRFYAWSVVVFAEEGLRDSRNIHCDAGYYFPGLKKALEDKIWYFENLSSMAAEAEKYLLSHMHRERLSSTITEALGILLTNRGNIRTRDLAGLLHISSRQLERIFHDNIGITPKKLSSLVRYQYLWQDIIYQRHFNILDAVHKYGYTDQAHLCRDFKSFHTMTIPQARLLAQSDR